MDTREKGKVTMDDVSIVHEYVPGGLSWSAFGKASGV